MADASPPVTVIIGATAVGKTRWAIRYAVQHNAEIISADSMQIYRHMDVGTAKPSPEERQTVPHHLIDVVDPDEPFSVYAFVKEANEAISDIQKRGKVPLIVGGTGLYINAFIRDFRFPSIPRDPDLQQTIKERGTDEGAPRLHDELNAVDPISAARISRNDMYRISRALEVFYLTGKPLSSFHQREKLYRSDCEIWWLQKDRDEIYRSIEERVDCMVEKGLFEEVSRLLSMGYSPDLPSMQALGYKESVLFLKGHVSREDCVHLIKKRTRNFAKRQLTWFRSFPITKEIGV